LCIRASQEPNGSAPTPIVLPLMVSFASVDDSMVTAESPVWTFRAVGPTNSFVELARFAAEGDWVVG
jgi:hypothetical protein